MMSHPLAFSGSLVAMETGSAPLIDSVLCGPLNEWGEREREKGKSCLSESQSGHKASW